MTILLRRSDFEAFWQAYPRKVGKLTALKAYYKAVQIALPEVILAGLERVKPGWAKRDMTYTPHASTWLNRGGWEDQEGPGAQVNGASEEVVDVSGLYYAADGTAELMAWDRYWISTRGVHAPRDKRFGFWFPSRWPPS